MNQLELLKRWLDHKGIIYTTNDEEVIDLKRVYISMSEHPDDFISVIYGHGSYGHNWGLLEVYVYGQQDVIGFLSALQVSKIIEKELKLYA